MVNYSQLSASALYREMEPFKDHASTHGHLTSLRSKSSLGNFQDRYFTEFLCSYSYHVMVKTCLAAMCVEAAFSEIQSHICTSYICITILKFILVSMSSMFSSFLCFLITNSLKMGVHHITSHYL